MLIAKLFDAYLGIVKNLPLIGADTGSTKRLKTKKTTVKRGQSNRWAVWNITGWAKNAVWNESAILGFARVQMTGSARVGDSVVCTVGVVELDESLVAASSTEAERLVAIKKAAKESLSKRTVPQAQVP